MNTLIGRGPVAEVHASGKSALKVFPGRFDRRTLIAIRREHALLKKVAAPVLPFTGIEVVDGRHALRMELCAESLAGRVRQSGPLPAPEVATLWERLSHALTAAHRVGVLHCGLTPENVLYRMTGEVVLADFGAAQRQKFPRELLHVAEWQPPETLRTGTVDAPADLYGLGAVLHFALTGESPHPGRIGETTAERLDRVLEPPPAISRTDVPVRLATVIGRLLASDPAKRAEGLRTDEDSRRTPAPTRSRAWLRVVSGSVAALVVAVGVLVAVQLQSRSAPASPAPGTSVPGAPARPTTAAAAPAVELADPVDLGDNRVKLSWTTSGEPLERVTIQYWAEGSNTKDSADLLNSDTRTTIVPVPSGARYCFQVFGSRLSGLVHSEPKAVHGANCDSR